MTSVARDHNFGGQSFAYKLESHCAAELESQLRKTVLEPKNPLVDECYAVQKRRSMDFDVLKLL